MKKLWINLILFSVILVLFPSSARAEKESVLKLSALIEEALTNKPQDCHGEGGMGGKKSPDWTGQCFG